MISTVGSKQEDCGSRNGAILCGVCMFSPGLCLNMTVNGCLPLCVSLAVDWQPIQSIPRHWPCDGMDWPLVLCDPKLNKEKKVDGVMYPPIFSSKFLSHLILCT